MIISALLMAAIISDASPGMRPDVYLRRSPTSLLKSRLSRHDASTRLCTSTLSIADGRVLDQRQASVGRVGHHEFRWSTADSTVWTLETFVAWASGIQPYNTNVLVLGKSDFEKVDAVSCPSRLRLPLNQQVQAPRNNEAGRRWAGPIFSEIANWAEKDDLLRRYSELDGWSLEPYNNLLLELLRDDGRGLNGGFVPFGSIAAVDSTKAVVAMYLYGSIAFIELKVEPAEKHEPRVHRSLKWKSLGVADTKLSSWASSFWIDDVMHLVSDDGKYESFRLEDRRMVPLRSSVAPLAPDALYCDGTAVWIVSKNEDGRVQAVKIPFKIAGEPKAEKRQWPKGMSIDEAVLDLAKE